MTRTQFPVVAGFALTVNKAQGLTIKEGVVINQLARLGALPTGIEAWLAVCCLHQIGELRDDRLQGNPPLAGFR